MPCTSKVAFFGSQPEALPPSCVRVCVCPEALPSSCVCVCVCNLKLYHPGVCVCVCVCLLKLYHPAVCVCVCVAPLMPCTLKLTCYCVELPSLMLTSEL